MSFPIDFPPSATYAQVDKILSKARLALRAIPFHGTQPRPSAPATQQTATVG